jgi:hypothetical protein
MLGLVQPVRAQETPLPELLVQRTDDFVVTGDGREPAWEKTPWVDLQRRPGGTSSHATQVKLLYSTQGLYVLMKAQDAKLTASESTQDFDNLWLEDVFEIFQWTDTRHPVYFEYEISPLGKELPILIPNLDGKFLGWRPWNYEGDRKTQKKVSVVGGEAKSGAEIKGWTAEVFIPYALLEPLRQVPPEAGTTWRANFYRVDYDQPPATAWYWAPVGPSFHEFHKFGTLRFQ